MPGFLITVTGNGRIWYLIGTIVFIVIGAGMAIGGFLAGGGGGTGTGIAGIVVGAAAVVLMIDAIMNLSS